MTSDGDTTHMRLQVILPTDVLVDEPVVKVLAEAPEGAFCLRPRHVDLVTTLVPGILSFVDLRETESFVATDTALLVKCGQDVWVSTPNAARGPEIEQLEALVRDRFLRLDDAERRARTALARLEAGTLRGFMELKELSHE